MFIVMVTLLLFKLIFFEMYVNWKQLVIIFICKLNIDLQYYDMKIS